VVVLHDARLQARQHAGGDVHLVVQSLHLAAGSTTTASIRISINDSNNSSSNSAGGVGTGG
jgi:hypothetical protein